jgi:adenylate cyclase
MSAAGNWRHVLSKSAKRPGTLLLICAVWTALFALLAGPVSLAPLELTELSLQDAIVRHGIKNATPDNMVFLAVDEASLDLSQLEPEEIEASPALMLMAEEFPWSRAVYAEVMEKVLGAGAKVLVLDVHFPLPGDGDEILREALQKHRDRVVIASVFEDSESAGGPVASQFRPPHPSVMPENGGALAGYANFWPGPDRVVRAVHFRVSEADFLGDTRLAQKQARGRKADHPGERRESLGALALRKAGNHRDVPVAALMRFAEPGSFPVYPLYQIFVPELWQANFRDGDVLRDKIVLLGPLAGRFRDFFRTPVGTLPGPEIHLHAMAAAQADAFYRRAAVWSVVLTCFAMGGLAFLVTFFLRRPLRALALLGLALAGYAAGALAVYSLADIMPGLLYPAGTLVLAGLTCFAYDFSLERRERARVRRSLERYVSRDVVRELIDNDSTLLSQLGGARKEVSVLFSDVRGFTALSETADPEMLVAQLNEYLGEMVGIVFRHDGTLDKFVGDAVMAVWGTVVSGGVTEDCRRAVRSALDMLATAEQMRRRWLAESRAQLRLGIGLNQGSAVFGNIGSEEKMEPTVIGDAVNLASRLEGLTKQYSVPLILSESVARQVRGTFPLRTVDTVRVKGRHAPVTVYTIPLDADYRPTQPDWLERHEQAWGAYRAAEFASARSLFAEVMVEGDATMAEMLRRCRAYEAEPPGHGWEAVVDLAGK